MPVHTNDTTSIDDINDKEALILLPETIVLFILLVVGVTGNGLLIYVYAFKFQQSNRRLYTLCLSAVDFFTCGVGIPLHIAMNVVPHQFNSGILCKVLWFPATISVLASGYLLIVVAVDRYLKICRPFKWQLTMKATKLLCAITLIVCTVLALPATVLYGRSSTPTEVGNVTGITCDIQDNYKNTRYPEFYNMLLFVAFCVGIVFIVVLYSLICKKMHKLKQKSKSIKSRLHKSHFEMFRMSKNNRGTHSTRISWMFLVITICGVASFVPCLVAHALKNHFGANISIEEYRLFSFIYNSFFLNMVANPFIYGFYDIHFRNQLRALFRRGSRTKRATFYCENSSQLMQTFKK